MYSPNPPGLTRPAERSGPYERVMGIAPFPAAGHMGPAACYCADSSPKGGSQGADKSVRPSSFYIVYTNGSPGFFSTGAGVAAATRVPLRTDRVKNTLPPTTEPLPMSVSPPRMDAPE